jgi:hypothetical protein
MAEAKERFLQNWRTGSVSPIRRDPNIVSSCDILFIGWSPLLLELAGTANKGFSAWNSTDCVSAHEMIVPSIKLQTDNVKTAVGGGGGGEDRGWYGPFRNAVKTKIQPIIGFNGKQER